MNIKKAICFVIAAVGVSYSLQFLSLPKLQGEKEHYSYTEEGFESVKTSALKKRHVAGNNLQLTVDARLQEVAESSMASGVRSGTLGDIDVITDHVWLAVCQCSKDVKDFLVVCEKKSLRFFKKTRNFLRRLVRESIDHVQRLV